MHFTSTTKASTHIHSLSHAIKNADSNDPWDVDKFHERKRDTWFAFLQLRALNAATTISNSTAASIAHTHFVLLVVILLSPLSVLFLAIKSLYFELENSYSSPCDFIEPIKNYIDFFCYFLCVFRLYCSSLVHNTILCSL